MGLRILAGFCINDGPNGQLAAVLYCSTSKLALPFMFSSGDNAEAFVKRFGDIRNCSYEEQAKLFEAWQSGTAGPKLTDEDLERDFGDLMAQHAAAVEKRAAENRPGAVEVPSTRSGSEGGDADCG